MILHMLSPGLERAEYGRFHINRAPSYGSYGTLRLNQKQPLALYDLTYIITRFRASREPAFSCKPRTILRLASNSSSQSRIALSFVLSYVCYYPV